ncbi:MAG: sensor histidine kinase [Cellulosilyticaceae bacterium]
MEHKNSLGRRLQIRKLNKKQQSLFPTLFSKLFTVYISILIGLLIFILVVFSNAFQSYFVEYTENLMIKQAEMIAEEYQQIGEFREPLDAVRDRIFFKIEILASYLDATTWVIDRHNNMLVVSPKSTLSRKIPQQQAIADVFEGQVVRNQSGFEQYFSTPVLTIGYPIEINGQVQSALFIHTPMPQILKTIEEVRIIIIKVVGLTSLLTFFLIYFISRQITKPLKEMNQVAKQIANGEFNKRILLEGTDEIGELASSLNDMARELDKIEENRKAFIANVSHDLRSPITSIQGFVTAILDGTIPPENQERYLHIVHNECQRLMKMANGILELNKMEEGKMPLKKMEFDIHEMIRDLLDNFESLTAEKSLTVDLVMETKQQLVFADPDKIVRVVQNLLDNSFKFVNQNGTIVVETKVKQQKVWVYIRNSGPPISEEDQYHIWDRFYKSDRSRGMDKKGMGIGLVIVKEIMKQHGEAIGVTSQPDEMVCFYFTLPTA